METTAVTQYPALTDVTQGIEVFMYDIAQSNQNQASWWNSVSHFCNNIIDAIKSTGEYFIYIFNLADGFIVENKTPVCIGVALSISIWFLWLDFIRNRG